MRGMVDHLSGAAAARQSAAGEKIAQLEGANAELLAANAALEQQVRASSLPPSWPRHWVPSHLNLSSFEVSLGDDLSAFSST
jgi:hypothetical protein